MSLGYTGYITPKLRARSSSPMPFSARHFDVVYRAKNKPFFPNRLGIIKSEIGDRFKREFSDQNLEINISTDPKDTISGDSWLDFIENSRAILGSNSGSSLLVRNHELVRTIHDFIKKHPKTEYHEIERNCFPGEDGVYEFTAISPRNFEAGLLKTLQLLVPGPYSGILYPWEHYVPLAEDCSNKKEVLCILKDLNEQELIINRCREKLLSSDAIQVEHFVDEVINAVAYGLPQTHKSMHSDKFLKIAERYTAEIKKYDYLYDKIIWCRKKIHAYTPQLLLNFIRR